MTRDEFESILEEAYIEGYNSALEDIQEDILDEEAYDLERDYDYYSEDAHPRSLRGTGIHHLPKGVLGALKKSMNAHKNVDKIRQKLRATDVSDNNWDSMWNKLKDSRKKARKAANDYIEKSRNNKQIINRILHGPDYKNPITRMISKQGIQAGTSKIMGKRDFLNDKLKY